MISSPLIPAQEALSLLGKAIFLDARAGPDVEQAFETAHLPGAIRVDLEHDLSELGDPANGGRHPLPALEVWLERVGRWGISPSTPVLIYDDGGGGMAAARAWWMLHAIGHEPLAVVDGGWQALRSLGAPSEVGETHPSPLAKYRSQVDSWPTVDAAFVERIRKDPSWRLIDARAPDRYAGRAEPLDPVAGHIPGARNLHWQSQLVSDGTFESRTLLRDRYSGMMGDASAARVVCYCGSGVTACHLLLAMAACGLHGAKLYVGSWSEWCRQGRALAVD